MADRKEVKELLDRASVEMLKALSRADDMSEEELDEVAGGLNSPQLRAFFDTNGTCGAVQKLSDLDAKAFFDTNGTCGASALNPVGAKIKR